MRLEVNGQERVIGFIEVAKLEHLHVAGAQHVVDIRFGELSCTDGLPNQRGFEPVRLGVQLEIRPCFDRGHRAVHRASVTHHVTIEAPALAQRLLQQCLIFAGPMEVEVGECAHHRGRPAILDHHFKGKQVDLMHGSRGNPGCCRPALALIFRLVACEVLDRCMGLAVRLHTQDLLCRGYPREVGVFTHVLLISPTIRGADHVDPGAPQGVMRPAANLRAEDLAPFEVDVGFEIRRGRDPARQRGRGRLRKTVATSNASPAIGKAEVWDVQRRNSLDVSPKRLKITGRRLILQVRVGDREVVDLLELLVQSHRREQRVRAFAGACRSVHPRRRRRSSRWWR
jgi:hypothetical protein